MAGLTAVLWEIGYCVSAVLQMAGQRYLGTVTENLGGWTWFWMAHDWRKPLQGASSCSWSEGWKSGHEPYKRGLNTKIHLAVDANGMPVRVLITEGTRGDCKEAIHLIEEISAETLLADRDMIPIISLPMPLLLGWKLSFRRNEIANNSGITTVIYIGCAIWWKMLFCT